jgi:hypothetical protein
MFISGNIIYKDIVFVFPSFHSFQYQLSIDKNHPIILTTV